MDQKPESQRDARQRMAIYLGERDADDVPAQILDRLIDLEKVRGREALLREATKMLSPG